MKNVEKIKSTRHAVETAIDLSHIQSGTWEQLAATHPEIMSWEEITGQSKNREQYGNDN